MLVTYNRSEILDFCDLTEEQRRQATEELGEDARLFSYVVCGGEAIFIGNFIDEPHLRFWDGVYPTSAFSGYYIKLSRDCRSCVVASRYF